MAIIDAVRFTDPVVAAVRHVAQAGIARAGWRDDAGRRCAGAPVGLMGTMAAERATSVAAMPADSTALRCRGDVPGGPA